MDPDPGTFERPEEGVPLVDLSMLLSFVCAWMSSRISGMTREVDNLLMGGTDHGLKFWILAQ